MSVQSDLAQAAKCYCFNWEQAKSAVVYLLASKSNLLSMTPAQLSAAAKCYCFDDDRWKSVVSYLLANEAGLSGSTPKQLSESAKCYCFDDETWKKVVVYLLNTGGSGPCPQDMQVAWTPTNVSLGPLMGFVANNPNVPLNGIQTLTFNHAFNLEGYSFGGGANTVQSIAFPNLASIGEAGFSSNGLNISNCGSLSSISAPLLSIVRGNLSISNNPSLTSITLTSLATLELALNINNNAITSLTLPSLINAGSNNLDFSSSPLLTSVSLPSLVPVSGGGITITFLGDGLDAASVNHVLARCVANVGYVAGVLELSGGTNAAPSGQGIADKATLIGRGVNVITN